LYCNWHNEYLHCAYCQYCQSAVQIATNTTIEARKIIEVLLRLHTVHRIRWVEMNWG
jgi:hypothetical protein